MENIQWSLLIFIVPFIPSYVNAQEDNPSEIRYEQGVQNAGDIFQIALPATAFIATLFEKDKKGSWQFIKSFGTNLALTYAIKYVINKPRPEGATDGHAFPSGHTSAAFQGASFLQRRYGWKYGIPAYAIASFVAYSRIEGLDERHDGWDILGGIIVGVGSTYLFTSDYQRDHFELSFSSENNLYQIGLKYRF